MTDNPLEIGGEIEYDGDAWDVGEGKTVRLVGVFRIIDYTDDNYGKGIILAPPDIADLDLDESSLFVIEEPWGQPIYIPKLILPNVSLIGQAISEGRQEHEMWLADMMYRRFGVSM